MKVSYKKLWKLLIDREMTKKELEEKAGISHFTMNKLRHGDNTTLETIGKICQALNCDINDIVEITYERTDC